MLQDHCNKRGLTTSLAHFFSLQYGYSNGQLQRKPGQCTLTAALLDVAFPLGPAWSIHLAIWHNFRSLCIIQTVRYTSVLEGSLSHRLLSHHGLTSYGSLPCVLAALLCFTVSFHVSDSNFMKMNWWNLLVHLVINHRTPRRLVLSFLFFLWHIWYVTHVHISHCVICTSHLVYIVWHRRHHQDRCHLLHSQVGKHSIPACTICSLFVPLSQLPLTFV